MDNNKRKSKADITVEIQTDNRAIGEGIVSLRDAAESILGSAAPTKRQRKLLVETAESLLALQNSVVGKIPDLIPDECTQ